MIGVIEMSKKFKRKLVSIQRIVKIHDIPDKDFIAVADILGWRVIIRKNEFKEGDLCIYCEIDTVLPETPEFEFLKSRKYRIKTIKMFGILSQGIAFPLSIIPKVTLAIRIEKNIVHFANSTLVLKEGQEITGLLKAKKYVPPILGMGQNSSKGELPSFIVRTDEPRIQAEPQQLEFIKDMPWYATVKIDGTSGIYAYRDGKTYVCGHNQELEETKTSAYWEMYYKYDFKKIFKDYSNIIVQGEIAGLGIQKNRQNLRERKLFVFNVIVNNKHYGYKDIKAFCEKYNLDMVPVEKVGNKFNFTLKELLEMAKGTYKSGKLREGLVFRPQAGTNSTFRRISFKVLNNDFLLKE